MNIDRVNQNLASGAYGVRSNRAGDAGQVFDSTVASSTSASTIARTAAPTDNVTLSDRARTMSRARSAAQSAPDIRELRILELQSQIQAGAYEFGDEQIVSRLLARSGGKA